MTNIPGICVKKFHVTDECLKLRGIKGCRKILEEALDEFEELAKVWEGKGAKIHLCLTVEIPKC